MAADGHSVVDLTDDSDTTTSGMASTPSSSSNYRFTSTSTPPNPSYLLSAANPAKRSRIDAATLNPLALLNPRAYVRNGVTGGTPDIQSSVSRAPLAQDRTPITLDKRLESLHGVKDRKTKVPTSKDGKRDVGNFQDRHSGNILLSKNVVNGGNSPNVIDLTGLLFLKYKANL